jgi:hypothetical protein
VTFNLAPAIYGTMMVGALLAAESARRETYSETVGAVLITLLLYWLAHSYSDFASSRIQETESFTLGNLTRRMVHELPILVGAAIPLIALLLAWILGAALTSAVTAAIWSSAATIFVIEVVAGVRTSRSPRQLALQTTIGAMLGLLIIVLKLVLH